MKLVSQKTKADDRPLTYDNPIAELIQRRRYQILVNSLLYYELDTTMMEDSRWAELAQDLVRLQREHPEIAEQVIFADAFRDFDGSTGFNLPFKDDQIIQIAARVLRGRKTAECEDALRRLAYVQSTGCEWDNYKKKSHKAPSTPVKKEVKKVEPQRGKGLFKMPRG